MALNLLFFFGREFPIGVLVVSQEYHNDVCSSFRNSFLLSSNSRGTSFSRSSCPMLPRWKSEHPEYSASVQPSFAGPAVSQHPDEQALGSAIRDHRRGLHRRGLSPLAVTSTTHQANRAPTNQWPWCSAIADHGYISRPSGRHKVRIRPHRQAVRQSWCSSSTSDNHRISSSEQSPP